MHNVDLLTNDELEFEELRHRRLGSSSLLDSCDLEVGKEFFTKDGFIATMKEYNIKNRVDF